MVHEQRIVVSSGGPNLLVRAIWFIVIGWWLGLIWSGIAWLLNITIIGLPLGLVMINKLPAIMTLRPATQTLRIVEHDGETVVTRSGEEQYPFFLRAAYFLLIGWWFSGIWMGIAYAFVLAIITIPLAFWMYDRVPAVTTLRRY